MPLSFDFGLFQRHAHDGGARTTQSGCRATHVALPTALPGRQLKQTAACDLGRQGRRGGAAVGSLLPSHVAGLDQKDPAQGAGALSRTRQG